MLKISLNDHTGELTIIENDDGVWRCETVNCGWSHTICGYGERAFIITTQSLQNGETSVVVLLSRVDSCIKIEKRKCKWEGVSNTINSMIEYLWTID